MDVYFQERGPDFFFHKGERGKSSLACFPHFHQDIEFFYLEEGKLSCQIDTDTYTVCSGDLLIAFPHQVHTYQAIEETDSHLLFIVHPDLVPELKTVFSTRQPKSAVVRHVDQHPELLELLQQLSRPIPTKKAYRDVVFKGLLLTFFGKLLSLLELDEPTKAPLTLHQVVSYCSLHFHTELSLEHLERELHLSRYYISHLFNHKLHIRFNDYVNALRIAEACRLLRSTDTSITEICAKVGFSTLRTFNRSFIKQLGMPPSEYRAAAREEADRGEAALLSTPSVLDTARVIQSAQEEIIGQPKKKGEKP